MTEYFVVANSFAAPFVSDQSTGFAHGETPDGALSAFAKAYAHPAGLYAADLFANATAYHKGAQPLAKWWCQQEIAIAEQLNRRGAVLISPEGAVDGKRIENAREGRLVPVR